MSNMSYCRYRNTLTDLRDCAEDLDQRASGMAEDELSREEFEAACRLIYKAQSLIDTIREAADIYGEDELSIDQIRTGLTKIEAGAQSYAQQEEAP